MGQRGCCATDVRAASAVAAIELAVHDSWQTIARTVTTDESFVLVVHIARAHCKCNLDEDGNKC